MDYRLYFLANNYKYNILLSTDIYIYINIIIINKKK